MSQICDNQEMPAASALKGAAKAAGLNSMKGRSTVEGVDGWKVQRLEHVEFCKFFVWGGKMGEAFE